MGKGEKTKAPRRTTPAPVRKGRLQRVLILGAESTGKTRLACDLASHFQTTWSPEYLREYFDRRKGKLTARDQLPIVLGHLRREKEKARSAHRVFFIDTDSLLSSIYFEHYFGQSDPRVRELANQEQYDLVLLTHPDVPWVADPQRDLPQGREGIHRQIETELRRRGIRWVDVRGDWEKRWATAVAAVEKLLSTVPSTKKSSPSRQQSKRSSGRA